jgi:hypothetical protein
MLPGAKTPPVYTFNRSVYLFVDKLTEKIFNQQQMKNSRSQILNHEFSCSACTPKNCD